MNVSRMSVDTAQRDAESGMLVRTDSNTWSDSDISGSFSFSTPKKLVPLTRTHSLLRPQKKGLVQLNQDEISRVRDAFHRYDADGSGFLEWDEFIAVQKGISGGHIFETDARKEFRKADTDHRGVAGTTQSGVDEQEFVNYLVREMQQMPAHMRYKAEDILRRLETWDPSRGQHRKHSLAPYSKPTTLPVLTKPPPRPATQASTPPRRIPPTVPSRATSSARVAKRPLKPKRLRLSKDNRDKLNAIFHIYDKDGNGSMDLTELGHIRRVMHGSVSFDRDLAKTRDLMRTIDKDFNRMVSKKEFVQYFEPELCKLGSQQEVADMLWRLEDGGKEPEGTDEYTQADFERYLSRAQELETRGDTAAAADMFTKARQVHAAVPRRKGGGGKYRQNLEHIINMQELLDDPSKPAPEGVVPPDNHEHNWPLPRGWVQCILKPTEVVPQGRRYYYGSRTGRSVWDRPSQTDYSEDVLAPKVIKTPAAALMKYIDSCKRQGQMPIVVDLEGVGAITLRAKRATFVDITTSSTVMRSSLKQAMQFGQVIIWDAAENPTQDIFSACDKVYSGLWEAMLSGQATNPENYNRLQTKTGRELFVGQGASPLFRLVWLQSSGVLPLWATKDNCTILDLVGGELEETGVLEQSLPPSLQEGSMHSLERADAILASRNANRASLFNDINNIRSAAMEEGAEEKGDKEEEEAGMSLAPKERRAEARRLSVAPIDTQVNELSRLPANDRIAVLGMLSSPPVESPRVEVEEQATPEEQPLQELSLSDYLDRMGSQADLEGTVEDAAADAKGAPVVEEPEPELEEPEEPKEPLPATRLEAITRTAERGLTALDLSAASWPGEPPPGAIPPETWTMKSLLELNLSGCGLDSLPPAVGAMHQLRGIDLAGNTLRTLPPEIFECDALESLNVASNQLTQLEVHFPKLHTLDASDNQLGKLPEQLGESEKLQVLRCSGSKLVQLPSALGKLKELRLLDISNNSLRTLPRLLGDGWGQLTVLNLAHNHMAALPGVAALGCLETLDISHNKFHELPLFPASAALRNLFAGWNAIAVLEAELWQSLPELRALELQDNNLLELPATLGSLSHLQTLNVGGNSLQNLPDEIGSLKELEVLVTAGNPLVSLPSALETLPLKTLDLSGGDFGPEGSVAIMAGLGSRIMSRGGTVVV